MAQRPPSLFINFKGFAEQIRRSAKRTGPSMDSTILELREELQHVARTARATLTAVDMLMGMLAAHKRELEVSYTPEEDIVNSIWNSLGKEKEDGQPA